MNYLLHSDVLAGAAGRTLAGPVRKLLAETAPTNLHVSVVALGEAMKAVRLRRTPSAELLVWLERIASDYGDRLLKIDFETAVKYAEIMAGAEREGRALTMGDALGAAAAMRYEMVLVTRPGPALAATGVRIWNAETGELSGR